VPPAPPPIDENVQKTLVYAPPIVVEELTNPDEILDWDKLQSGAINKPVDIDIEFVPADHGIIEEPPDDGPILFPSEPATFMGCADLTCFHKWVLEHIKYPDDAAAQNVFGKVILEFCISAKGEVVDVKVLRKIHPSIDEEAIRVITSSPIWSPARQGGKQVKQKFVIPCSFEMN
jgi:TonB family protein